MKAGGPVGVIVEVDAVDKGLLKIKVSCKRGAVYSFKPPAISSRHYYFPISLPPPYTLLPLLCTPRIYLETVRQQANYIDSSVEKESLSRSSSPTPTVPAL